MDQKAQYYKNVISSQMELQIQFNQIPSRILWKFTTDSKIYMES